jgi:hypothetical protein
MNKMECDAQCHAEVTESYGLEPAVSWMGGDGPYDGWITFEYTRDRTGSLEGTYRCPSGSRLQCGSSPSCVGASDAIVEAVFDGYSGTGPGAMRIANFRSGLLCGNSVCQQASVIQVTGEDTCERGKCTRYGIEFDYGSADPSSPLECSSSSSGGSGDDFVGGLLKMAADVAPQQGDGSGQGGMAEMLGVFQKVLRSADSPEDVQISMAPLGPDGQPIESKRVGTEQIGPPSVPRTLDLPATSGHLVVPMYQLADTGTTEPRVRAIRCTHKGVPVLETTFKLQF